MNLAQRITRTRILLFVLLIVSLLIAALLVIHTAMPSVWHLVSRALGPNVIIPWH
jgi:hypothetical protein